MQGRHGYHCTSTVFGLGQTSVKRGVGQHLINEASYTEVPIAHDIAIMPFDLFEQLRSHRAPLTTLFGPESKPNSDTINGAGLGNVCIYLYPWPVATHFPQGRSMLPDGSSLPPRCSVLFLPSPPSDGSE